MFDWPIDVCEVNFSPDEPVAALHICVDAAEIPVWDTIAAAEWHESDDPVEMLECGERDDEATGNTGRRTWRSKRPNNNRRSRM
jgi:hypothetical protein